MWEPLLLPMPVDGILILVFSLVVWGSCCGLDSHSVLVPTVQVQDEQFLRHMEKGNILKRRIKVQHPEDRCVSKFVASLFFTLLSNVRSSKGRCFWHEGQKAETCSFQLSPSLQGSTVSYALTAPFLGEDIAFQAVSLCSLFPCAVQLPDVGHWPCGNRIGLGLLWRHSLFTWSLSPHGSAALNPCYSQGSLFHSAGAVVCWSRQQSPSGPGFDHPPYSLCFRVTLPSVEQPVANLLTCYSGLQFDSHTKSTCDCVDSFNVLHLEPLESQGHHFWPANSTCPVVISILLWLPCSVWEHSAKWHLARVPKAK